MVRKMRCKETSSFDEERINSDTKEGLGWAQLSVSGTKNGWVVHQVKWGTNCAISEMLSYKRYQPTWSIKKYNFMIVGFY